MSERKPGMLLLLNEKDLKRVGNCWMKGRLMLEDLVMCLKNTGDSFYEYCLVEHHVVLHQGNKEGIGYKAILESKFSAYSLSTPYYIQPTEREAHLLVAGEQTHLEADVPESVDSSEALAVKFWINGHLKHWHFSRSITYGELLAFVGIAAHFVRLIEWRDLGGSGGTVTRGCVIKLTDGMLITVSR